MWTTNRKLLFDSECCKLFPIAIKCCVTIQSWQPAVVTITVNYGYDVNMGLRLKMWMYLETIGSLGDPCIVDQERNSGVPACPSVACLLMEPSEPQTLCDLVLL